MSRDFSSALRQQPGARFDLNPVLEEQLAQAGGMGGAFDLDALLRKVSARYDQVDAERRGVVRSMQLMSDEAQALTREIREETASHVQVILDNVKDAILTLDRSGRLESINPTGERLFGYAAAEILGRGLDVLLPQTSGGANTAAAGGGAGTADGGSALVEFLDRCAATMDDTHVDLAAHQTWGRSKSGNTVAVEITVSAVSVNRRDGYIVCIRDTTERKRGDVIAAGERRVFEKIASDAPLPAVLESIAELIERVIAGSLCAINLLGGDSKSLNFGAAPSLPREFLLAMDRAPLGLRFGSCSAAAHLGREVTVEDIAADGLWHCRREAARHAGVAASWSTPIVGSDGTIIGTFSSFRREPGTPQPRDRDFLCRMAQIAGIAIERRYSADALRDSEVKFRGLCDSVMEGVYRTSRDGRFQIVNPALVEMLGYDSAEELYRVPAGSLYWYPSDRESYVRRMDAEGEIRSVEYVFRRKDGTMLVVLVNGRAVFDTRGQPCGFEGTITDVTERKRAETAVFQAKERAQVTLQSIGDAVITTDATGRIDYMNPVAESLTGWEGREAESHSIETVLTVVDEATRSVSESPVTRCLREGRILGLAEDTVLVNRRGQEIAIQYSAAPMRDRAGNLIGAVMVFHDISKERRLHRALHYQASHDALTGLINRREFDNRLATAVDGVRADPSCRHALLYLDLDQFKLVNDTCGHQAGDLLLKQITGVLQSCIRIGDTLARLGGDEFGILLQSCALDQALRVAESLRQAIQDYRFIWQDGVLAVGVSIGIVEIGDETPMVANVMSAADVACYAAKDQGRNRVQLYQPDNVPERHREMLWVSKLTRACDESRFELYYQPIVPIGANRLERQQFEIMLRLRDESGALIAPAEFIPAAERYNVMPSIDRWVVRQALDQAVHRRDSGVKPYTIAVNLSGTSLNDERFLEYLIAQLSGLELCEGAVCFEITETSAIANLNNVVHFMRELRSRGCHFALDDFGSGLSSFVYLKTLPVDYLKIDGRFVENVVRDPVDRSMVEAISQVGKAMGIHTVAERVESVEVLEALGRIGVDFAQGYHIAAPRSLTEFPHRRAVPAAKGPAGA